MSTVAGRNAWIDATRGISAAAVAMFHFNCVQSSGPADWRAFWNYGHLGVAVFFVLSGWCITSTWLRSPSVGNFALHRARRILPAYYASILLVFALVGLTKLFLGTNDVTRLPVSPGAILATLSLTTAPVTNFPTINWVYWSLSYEIAFYALLAGLLVVTPLFRPMALAGLHLVLCAVAVFLNPPSHGPGFFITLWPLFGLGAALVLRASAPRASLLMLVVSALHAAHFFSRGLTVDYLMVALLTALWLVVIPHLPFNRWLDPLRQLGIFSYSLYLVHVPLGIYVILRLLPQTYTSASAFVAAHLGWLAGVIVLAWGFHRLCERPFLPSFRPVPSR